MADRDRLRRSMSLPNLAKQQHDSKAWERKKILSEKVASGLKDRKLHGNRWKPFWRTARVKSRSWIETSPMPLTPSCSCCKCGRTPMPWLALSSLPFCAAQEAEEARSVRRARSVWLCYSGASLDDALSTMTIDRDMLRSLLMPRPKIEKPPSREPREPLKRKQPKRRPTGECFKWIAGECKQRQCKFKHKCATCGSPDHHSGACSKKSHQ